MTKRQLDFYFDFSSPYAYLASCLMDDFARVHDIQVNWHAFLLGAVFKKYGGAPLVEHPLKAPYVGHDLMRSAAFYGVEYKHPNPFPVMSIHAVRAFYHIKETLGANKASHFAKAVFKAYFTQNLNISDIENIIAIANVLGYDDINKESLILNDLKEKTHKINDDNMAKGIFGTPYFVVEGEYFWGVDRLNMLSHWLKTGQYKQN